MLTTYLLLALAIVVITVFVCELENRMMKNFKQQHDIIGRLITMMEQQDAINTANRQFAESAMDLLNAQAEVIDNNAVNIETLAKSDLST